ncbi:MAG: AraC family transcriptional regulator [Bacteroidota bacterium]
MQQFKMYPSISAFFQSINLKIEQDFDFTIHQLDLLHGEPPTQSPLFRTNYYAFLLIESGKGHYTIDDHNFTLHNGSYYFTNPGHLKSFYIEENLVGYMMTFSEGFLQENFPLSLPQEFPFLYQETTPVMELPHSIFDNMKSTFELLLYEYKQKSPFKKRIVGSHLVSILYKTKELLIKYKAKLEPETRSGMIAKSFQQLLNKNMLEVVQQKADFIWNVNDYASFLNLHPNHLNQTIKTETGKTIKQWTDEKLFSEAKTFLKNTELTVAEIAFQLKFSDTSNFSRFFKKMSGESPSKYRSNVK